MKTLRIAQAALAMTLAMGINSTTYAFMAVPTDQPADVQVSLSEMVDSLRQEIAAGETKCEEMLAKLNTVLADIDAKLDAGVENEEELLATREEVAKMRYDLECLAQKLTQDFVPMPDGGFGPSVGGDFTGNGGFVSSGGGGGGGSTVGGGVSSLRRLAVLGGITTAITVPLATEDDTPGFVASDSIAN